MIELMYTAVVEARPAVAEVQEIVAKPFDTNEVTLLDSPFKAARDRHAAYLLSLEADRLLSKFRTEQGLEAKAPPYGGWEGQTIAGHSLGHYLSGIAKMYASTGDVRFKERADYMVKELAECQDKGGDGLIAAFPKARSTFAEVAAGNIRSQGFDLNGLWVPWYTLHKQFAGLHDVYRYTDNKEALEVSKKLGDWSIHITSKLTDEQFQKMLDCEQGGMTEVLAELYALTSEEKYAALARRFNHRRIVGPLSQGRDVLPGIHANTQVPKIIGAARQRELLRDSEDMGKAAEFFWTTVTTKHSYANGGNSLNEYFGPPGIIAKRLRGNTSETCNTYNMLKLTRHLHSWKPQASYMDYYERAMFNHILASQDPQGAGVVYYLPLSTPSRKPFQRLTEDFTCCVGTGMENHASYGDMIYSHTGDTLYVNLFTASSVKWKEKGIEVLQETKFPESDSSRITVKVDSPTAATIKIRKPAWAEKGYGILVNGAGVNATEGPDGYLELRRTWTSGDTLEVKFPMTVRVEPTPDDANKLAVFYGPLLLAADLGERRPSPADMPFVVTEAKDASWIRQDGSALAFETVDAAKPKELKLVPLYQVGREHYAVYFDRMTPAEYSARLDRLKKEEEERQKLESLTVDFVQPGEMQPERDHGFAGEQTEPGEYGGKKFRHAPNGGWFAFDLAVPPDGKAKLVCTYWGSETGPRTFDIFVDDVKIATESLKSPKPEEFYEKAYEIPAELLRGKQKVRLKFAAHPRNVAGGVFGIRMIRSE